MNSNGRGLFCYPMVFVFLMVDKMAAILFVFPIVLAVEIRLCSVERTTLQLIPKKTK